MQTVKVENPHAYNMVMGQLPFVSAIDEINQTLVENAPGIRYGIAFNEDAAPMRVCASGNDSQLIDLAKKNVSSIGAIETFVLFFHSKVPQQIMHSLKNVPEITEIYCATDDQVEIIVAQVGERRDILGLLGGYNKSEVKVEHIVKPKGFWANLFCIG